MPMAWRRSALELTAAIDKLLDNLPPDFPNRAYYDEITAAHGIRGENMTWQDDYAIACSDVWLAEEQLRIAERNLAAAKEKKLKLHMQRIRKVQATEVSDDFS